ncbi:MAG: hypothetical protein QXY82_00695 [Desulfurococcaceae archaeon]
MSYIDVDEKLLRKHCSDDKICFWNHVVLINPIGSDDTYIFDCALYKLLKTEFEEYPDARLLLAFKSPIALYQLHFASQLHYKRLPEVACDKEEVESYIRNTLKIIDEMVEEARSLVARPSGKEQFLRFIIPARTDRAVARGVYYGLLVKRSILDEMVSRLGYEGGSLKANVKAVYVLHSVDLSKKAFTALIRDKSVKLNAHSKMVNLNALLKALETSP